MKKTWKRLICLALLVMLCLAEGLAFSDGNGSLTVTIGNSESQFDRKGIGVELYRISTNYVGEDWGMLPAFSSISLNLSSAEKTDVTNADIRKAISSNNVRPTATGQTNTNGQIVFPGLESGIYFGRITEKPQYLEVQDFLVSVPQKQNGNWKFDVSAELKHSYVTPTPTTTPTSTPTATPTVTPTITPPNETPELPETVPPTPQPRPTPNPPGTPHKLVIHYIYYDTGKTAAPDHNETLWEGERYDVWSPIIPDYWYDIPEVAGIMPNHDMEYTVYYFTRKTGWNYITLDEYETALGIGMIQMHVGVCYE